MTSYDPGVTWDDLVVFGIQQSPTKVTINGKGSSFSYNQKQQVLLSIIIRNLKNSQIVAVFAAVVVCTIRFLATSSDCLSRQSPF